MANSGSFNTTAYEVRYLTFEWSLASQSTASNQSVINWTLKGAGSNSGYWYYVQNVTLTVNGVQVYRLPKSSQIKLYGGTVLASGQSTISHDAVGNKTFSASCTAGIYEHDPNVSGSGSWALPQIPRYANITTFELAAKTETSFSFNWATDKSCTAVYYDIYDANGNLLGSSPSIGTGTSGGFTISHLLSGTGYQVRIRCVANGLERSSDRKIVETYSYPYASTTPDFVIGNDVTIGLYNPLGHQVTVELMYGTYTVATVQTSGTSVSGFDNIGMRTMLYSSIPNAQSGQYRVKVTYDTTIHEPITVDGGNYSVNPSVVAPTIGSISYQDANNTAVSITGDNQKIVRSISLVRYTASSIAAKNSASIASVKVYVNGAEYSLTVSGNSATGGNAAIDSGTDVEARIVLTDSRGLTAEKTMTVSMINWQPPSAIASAKRQDNFYSETDLTVDAEWTQIGSNGITIIYQATKDGDSSPSVSGTLQDNVTSVAVLDNRYGWSITITVTDSFGGSRSYTIVISRGMPIIYFDRIKSSVGINCFPAEEKSLEIGDEMVIINGKKLVFGAGGSVTWEAV